MVRCKRAIYKFNRRLHGVLAASTFHSCLGDFSHLMRASLTFCHTVPADYSPAKAGATGSRAELENDEPKQSTHALAAQIA